MNLPLLFCNFAKNNYPERVWKFLKTTLKWTYKVLRSILFSAIIAIVVVTIAVYIALSIPPVQGYLRDTIQKELSDFLGSKVVIRNLTIHPMNEMIVEDLLLFDLDNKECLRVERLGAGINMWRLMLSGEIEITYVELLDFKASIYQREKDAPLNIDFIIKAFEPKDKTKPPTKFDLKIHNVVIRRGNIEFDRIWQPHKGKEIFDVNHIAVSDFSADIALPKLNNNDLQIDLRRLSFMEKSGLELKDLSGNFQITPDMLTVKDFSLQLPSSLLKLENLNLPIQIVKNFKDSKEKIGINIYDSYITPSNIACFYPSLKLLTNPVSVELIANGNMDEVSIGKLSFRDGDNIEINLVGEAHQISNPENLYADIDFLKAHIGKDYLQFGAVILGNTQKTTFIAELLPKLQNLDIALSGKFNAANKSLTIDTDINTGIGALVLKGEGQIIKDNIVGSLEAKLPKLDIGTILPESPLNFLRDTELEFTGEIFTKDFKASQGEMSFSIGEMVLLHRTLSELKGALSATSNLYSIYLNINDKNIDGEIEASLNLAGENSTWNLEANLRDFDTYNAFISRDESNIQEITGSIVANGTGISPEDMAGSIKIEDFNIHSSNGKSFSLKSVNLDFINRNNEFNHIDISSELFNFHLGGYYDIMKFPGMVRKSLGEVMPSIFPPYMGPSDCGSGDFTLEVKEIEPIIDFFHIPLVPLTQLSFMGEFDSERDLLLLSTNIPYIQQGNNLITDTYIEAKVMGAEKKAELSAGTIYPTKKGLLKLDLDIDGDNGMYEIMIDFNRDRNVSFHGSVYVDVSLERNPLTGELEITAEWIQSQLYLNGAEWNIEDAFMQYDRNGILIRNFNIRHSDQFLLISGNSTKYGEGEIMLNMANINVDYIFDTLNINHVDFGGTATGKAVARSLFSDSPDIHTENLIIKDLSYNGAVIGDGKMTGSFDLPNKKVSIGGKIYEGRRLAADVDGGVWIGRDSLAFNFKADSVNAAVVKPFMSAFSSDIRGSASGEATLYGTFSDIDMTGSIVANDVEILIDYINARYSTSDTIRMKPGIIDISNAKVQDKFGKTAIVNGIITHRYFHEPAFKFTISEMDNLLVYDTNPKLNPLWYGTLFAFGAGEITGEPGWVNIKADVETGPGSDFTFVLSDQQQAVKSTFLTFSDKRKAELEASVVEQLQDTVPEFLKRFQKTNNNIIENESSDIFTMDIRASVNQDVKMNLIMDPIAGDKITAYGDGAMNMSYSSLTDELKLYGKYILEKGTYNFSLQDIILKEFTIKPGSSIAFTGDPYTGILDITAAYRVNTNLTELDNSFSNDRELNRTSVPVEALLNVSGVLTSPTIAFDIDLPTVTEETAQKVRSIISTEDMMSRQVLYLVALNKFYPPEYMSTSNSGGEWASIATSTISSQIQNMIGQITDKFTLAPSIKSDKGDFSDIEFDLGLSSQLFNNRLLINGNLGYRDPSNSSTTFVGDFDLEYLLNKKGTWRLKAYNHFNDQNYYLKSSLTTQGIGIVWRKDFGIPRKKEEISTDDKSKNSTDTIKSGE